MSSGYCHARFALGHVIVRNTVRRGLYPLWLLNASYDEASGGSYIFLGSAYVHGIMRGQAKPCPDVTLGN
jgi:hypothetical protein